MKELSWRSTRHGEPWKFQNRRPTIAVKAGTTG
jgi:hypothetical protein